MPSANASLLTCGHHTCPVAASVHSASLTWFQPFRSPASDGAAICSPLSWYRSRSSLRVRTAQLRAYRRPPNCRRRHAAWAGDRSSAKQNACALHPSGISNLAIATLQRPPQELAGPVAGRREGGIPLPGDTRPHPLRGQFVGQPPRFLLPPPDLRRPPGVDRVGVLVSDGVLEFLEPCRRRTR